MPGAFQAITTRLAWYCGEAVSQYCAVEFGVGGKLMKATGAGQFAGIIEYGADAADDMVTAVKGIFPAVAAGAITAGAKVTIDAANPGKFIVGTTGKAQYGIALNDAAAGELVSIAMADVAPVAIA